MADLEEHKEEAKENKRGLVRPSTPEEVKRNYPQTDKSEEEASSRDKE